jgi:hypothetical protein
MALAFGFGRERSGMTITSKGSRAHHHAACEPPRAAHRPRARHPRRADQAGDDDHPVLARGIDAGETRDLPASYCWLNPHAIFRFDDEPARSVGTAVAKWPTGAPTPPHWYTPERFAHILRSTVR